MGEGTEGGDVLLPVPLIMLRTVGILPDISGLEAGVRSGLPLYYRPAPSLGWQTKGAARLLGEVLDAYPIAAVTPLGESVSGYPDVGPIAAEPKKRGVPVAAVEFSRQLGAVQLTPWPASSATATISTSAPPGPTGPRPRTCPPTE